MTYVVSSICINCKHSTCVEVCPVDCFHEGENMLVIDPNECIDCSLCVPECPVEAIFADDELPDDEIQMIAVNAEFALKWPVITSIREAPADAHDWAGVKNKYPDYFSPNPGVSEDE